jgi:hypothetical protein
MQELRKEWRMTKKEIAELESRIDRTIEEFKKDHEVTTSDANGVLFTIAVSRTVRGLENMKDENVNLVQMEGQSPVPDSN